MIMTSLTTVLYAPNDIAAANDRTNPALDVGRTARKYAGISQDFRASSWKCLDEGDLPQASNKSESWWTKRSRPSAHTMAALPTPTALLLR